MEKVTFTTIRDDIEYRFILDEETNSLTISDGKFWHHSLLSHSYGNIKYLFLFPEKSFPNYYDFWIEIFKEIKSSSKLK